VKKLQHSALQSWPAIKLCCELAQVGLHQLSGHHSAGGLRVCIYNGIPDEGLELLMIYMEQFQKQNDPR
jgi:phosphoserine aminotransferase